MQPQTIGYILTSKLHASHNSSEVKSSRLKVSDNAKGNGQNGQFTLPLDNWYSSLQLNHWPPRVGPVVCPSHQLAIHKQGEGATCESPNLHISVS